jgi:lipopolysaccharide/colanic/teichoic acid biosynthesis glycosyltransferase
MSARAYPSAPAVRPGRVTKRALDVTVALLSAAALAPLFVLLALLIKADSAGPVLYRCPRIGKGGRHFAMYKFRKMADRASGPAITVAGDPRFTRVGSQLARFKLDELPQLINVVKGEMSLVGPRPEDARYVELHDRAYAQILEVLPGVTGLSQLAFARESAVLGSEAPLEVYVDRILPQKVEIDLLYAANRSLAMDLRILWWTAVAVFARREVAVNRDSGKLGLRRRPAHRPSDVVA